MLGLGSGPCGSEPLFTSELFQYCGKGRECSLVEQHEPHTFDGRFGGTHRLNGNPGTEVAIRLPELVFVARHVHFRAALAHQQTLTSSAVLQPPAALRHLTRPSRKVGQIPEFTGVTIRWIFSGYYRNPETLDALIKALGVPNTPDRVGVLHQHVLEPPAPVVADALDYHHHMTTRTAATWTRCAAGPRARRPSGWAARAGDS